MKLTKKLFLAALAVTCLSLVGCPKDIGESGIIGGGGMGWDAGVDDYYNEDTENIVRSLKRTKQKHSGGIYTVQQTVHDAADGMLGVVFGLKENSKGLYDFFVVGTSYQSGGERGYISYFVNVDGSNFSAKNFGVAAANKKTSMADMIAISDNANNTTAYEYEIKALGADVNVSSGNRGLVYNSSTHEYKVKIVIYPEFNTHADEYTGNYFVEFYPGDADVTLDEVSASGNTKKHHEVNTTATLLSQKKISGVFDPQYLIDHSKNTQNNDAEDLADYNNLPQLELGYYCNVYAGKTLTGKWKLENTVNEVVEE